jgi:hypothetical protein
MHVVGHEHIRVQRALVLIDGCPQPMEIELEILVVKKARGAIVTALHKVKRHIIELDSGWAGHSASLGQHSNCTMTLRKYCAIVSNGCGENISELINPDPISGSGEALEF